MVLAYPLKSPPRLFPHQHDLGTYPPSNTSRVTTKSVEPATNRENGTYLVKRSHLPPVQKVVELVLKLLLAGHPKSLERISF